VGDRALLLIVSGIFLMLGTAFVADRVQRSLRHGFSIRLQLFLAASGITAAMMGIFGLLVFDRLQTRVAEVVAREGASVTRVLEALIRDFGPEVSVMAVGMGFAAAVSSWLLGRGVAAPMERLTAAAERIARGERQAVLPEPDGREVRRLTAAFEQMRRSLEDKHAIEQFVADLSHELKNPVSAIRAACEVLIDEGAKEDPAARDRFLGRIDEASGRLELLLADLLALARLEARGLKDDAGSVELQDVVRAAIDGFAQVCERRNLRFETELVPVRLDGSPTWLRRAIDNLLSNAVRHAPDGSSIEVTLRSAEERATLTVRDRGRGVPEAMRGRIFERFVTQRAHAGGTGLGLAIVRSVAEHHGGAVQLVDAEGPGACFSLSLPRPPRTGR
jgi:signal transduction histidine kinase